MKGILFGPRSMEVWDHKSVTRRPKKSDVCRYQPGDVCYVREAWRADESFDRQRPLRLPDDVAILFEPSTVATVMVTAKREISSSRPADAGCLVVVCNATVMGRTRNALHLPARLARRFVRITSVGEERLCAVTEKEAVLEGCQTTPGEQFGWLTSALRHYGYWWNELYPRASPWAWHRNPIVRRSAFEKLTRVEAGKETGEW